MLELVRVSKHFSGIPAVDDVTFSARPGQVTGYLGPNGSGKSTTMKMITGLIEMTFGQISFQGKLIQEDLIAYKRRMGYVPEEPYLYTHLSGAEYLTMVAQLRNLPVRASSERIDGLLRLLSLYDDRHASISGYSKGMRQKVLIAAALLHNPELILLDEPFSGLDVASALVLRSLIQELAARGKVVLFSSHELDTVERICSRVVILHRGKLVADDTIERLRYPHGTAHARRHLFAARRRAGHRCDGPSDRGPDPCISFAQTRPPPAASVSRPLRQFLLRIIDLESLVHPGRHPAVPRTVRRRPHHVQPASGSRRILECRTTPGTALRRLHLWARLERRTVPHFTT